MVRIFILSAMLVALGAYGKDVTVLEATETVVGYLKSTNKRCIELFSDVDRISGCIADGKFAISRNTPITVNGVETECFATFTFEPALDDVSWIAECPDSLLDKIVTKIMNERKLRFYRYGLRLMYDYLEMNPI